MQAKNLIASVLLILFLVCSLAPLSLALTPEEVAQTALASTVLIVIQDNRGRSSLGSGFVIGEGQIATNAHVVEGVSSGTVKLVGSETEYAIDSILSSDRAHDLAIVEATGITASALSFGDSDTIQVGQNVYAAGNPQGLTGTFSSGIISAIRPEGNSLVADTILQMTTPVSPGSSGGPLLNVDGEVIGIVFSQVTRGQNLNFAIPVNFLKTLLATTTDESGLYILDPNLHTKIVKALGKTLGSPITTAEMATLTSFTAKYGNIKDLTGLEHATNLTSLNLYANYIKDLSPLAGLTNLTSLNLYGNDFKDLSPLAGLTNLTSLNLKYNEITDISSLAGLTNLTMLNLWDNRIWDVSALEDLTSLESLFLGNNLILDLSPLVANTGLGTGDVVDLRINRALSDTSLNTHIPALRTRGVKVHRTYVYLSGPSIVTAGQTVTLDLNVENTVDLDRVKLEVDFRTTDSSIVSVAEGDFLKQNSGTTYFIPGRISSNKAEEIEILHLTDGGVSGSGVLASITFKGHTIGYGFIHFDVELLTPSSEAIPHIEQSFFFLEVVASWDINGDGEVNVTDLLIVAQKMGDYDDAADLDGDERVTVEDFVIVASHLGETVTSEAPSVVTRSSVSHATIQKWIDMAHAANDESLAFQRGIANLERLLNTTRPNVTALLPNYPNPFNPETWIPYHLAHAADVTLTIYDTKGVVMRQFDLGHQPAGYYTDKTQAAYWDGRNNLGEPVGSGVYFYQLQVENSRSETGAGDFSATRKLVILK